MKSLIISAFALTLTVGGIAMADHVGHDHDHDHGHGGHHHREVVCKAKNLRGQTFEAIGHRRESHRVQERAMNRCQRHSVVCISLGCSRH